MSKRYTGIQRRQDNGFQRHNESGYQRRYYNRGDDGSIECEFCGRFSHSEEQCRYRHKFDQSRPKRHKIILRIVDHQEEIEPSANIAQANAGVDENQVSNDKLIQIIRQDLFKDTKLIKIWQTDKIL